MTTSNIAQKYALEKAKRINPKGLAQYDDLRSEALKDLTKDPWIDYASLAREDPPLKDGGKIKFLVIGAGHNGLTIAARLIDAGFDTKDICLVDVAGGFGGTWYWNRYPGLMCDVEGYVYLPLLEETGYVPKHRYSYGAEIRGQSERIGKQWKMRPMFSTRVTSQTWNEATGHWDVGLNRYLGPNHESQQLSVQAQFVFPAGGVLSIPKVPDKPGFEQLRKNVHVFHTSRWDYAYTGGTQEKPDMTGLRGKRVAIIGTGATAIQVVPELAKWAKHLYVIQRTPSYCGERNQRLTEPEAWAKVADGPGWQNRRRINFNRFITNDPDEVDLISDGWTDTPGGAGFLGSRGIIAPDKIQEHVDHLLEVDTPRANKVRARIEHQVKDPEVAEKLKPWYPGWCKRPTFNDDYLAAFNRPNVTLIDTDGQGVERYTEHGLVAGGAEIAVDVLVMATGFAATGNSLTQRLGYPIVGRGGRTMSDKWEAADFGTVFGVATHGFPNMFACFFRGVGSSWNLTSTYDIVARLTAHILREAHRQARADGLAAAAAVVEATKEAEDRYTDEVQRRAGWYHALTICTPSYFTGEGDAIRPPKTPAEAALKARGAVWGSGVVDYQERVEEYMGRGGAASLEGFDVRA